MCVWAFTIILLLQTRKMYRRSVFVSVLIITLWYYTLCNWFDQIKLQPTNNNNLFFNHILFVEMLMKINSILLWWAEEKIKVNSIELYNFVWKIFKQQISKSMIQISIFLLEHILMIIKWMRIFFSLDNFFCWTF